jgi:hypothetical protein
MRNALVSALLLALLALAAAGAQPGVTDTEILLGCSNSFSGPLAFSGEQATKFGVDLYFKALNDGGGIVGRKLRTIYYDDGYRPQDAAANTKKLVEQDKVFAIIAPQGTPAVVATLDYLEENKVPMLFPFQGSPVTRGKKLVFNGMLLYDRQAKIMVDYLAGPRKYTKFATLYQDDEYGKAYTISCKAWLAPFDLGVSQRVTLNTVPTQMEDVFEVKVIIDRESGDISNWKRVNRRFLNTLRKQFLIWRTLRVEEREKYLTAAAETATGAAGATEAATGAAGTEPAPA